MNSDTRDTTTDGVLGRPIRVLLADDEEPLRRILSRELGRKGHDVVSVEDGQKAIARLGAEEFDVAVLDVRMPGQSGVDVLRLLAEEASPPEVILLTGNATVEIAVEAMRLGAYDFQTKPCRIEVLDALVRAAAHKKAMAKDNEHLRRREEHHEAKGAGTGLVHGWNSKSMQPVVRLISRLAPSELPVLILGPSGVGKELVAREIHSKSRCSTGPFVDLNCAAIPDALLESELFGHEKGAFTGAGNARAGLMEAADGGTLFLDEIGELPGGLQVKLLRVLETMSFFRVGGRKKVQVSVRLVAATNRDLLAASQQGAFRADLYYRINAGTIQVPPLCERREEVQALAEFFLSRAAPGVHLVPSVVHALENYDWPGNVRELRNVVERAALLSQDDEIRIEDLPRELLDGSMPSVPMVMPEIAMGHTHAVSATPPADWDSCETGSLQSIERGRILEVLESTHWHRGRAADILGISVRTLYRKIKTYRLDQESPAMV